MAYGRLDVFWPDGTFKTFHLVENNISVGRSSGNTIALDTTTISRYHFSITHDGQQVYLTDLESVNGTFIDGVKLASNEPRVLFGGEEIQVGHLRMVYHHIDEMPTQPMAALEETTQRIELELPAFRIDVIGPDQAFSPGAHMSAELSITNTSDIPQRYRVEVTGMPSDWIRLDRSEVEIAAGETAQVLINFRPQRRPESKPGNYRVTARVSIKDSPEAKLEALFEVRILPYGGFGMALETRRISGNERFRLHVHNQGSAVLPLTISGKTPGDKLRFNILAPQVSLAPGQRLVIQGEVRPRQPALFGNPRTYPFDVQVRSTDAAGFLTVVRGQYQEKPALPAWTPLALVAGALVALIAAVVLLALLLTPPRPPQIVSFEVNSTQVAQGELLTLKWAATDVSELVLSVNGTPISTPISPQTSELNLDTSSLAGSVDIALVGTNGGQEISAAQSVYVYRPLETGLWTVDPPQLVRYVVQTLTINWDIPGAIVTRLTGLETFSQTQLANSYTGTENLTGIVGIPTETLTLRLYVEDEVGNSDERTLDIPVIDPECVPAGNTITLYAGPDARHQVVGTVPAGAIVVVDVQDSSGQWLRAQLPGGNSGWGVRAEFRCADTFNPADLRKELLVPTVPPPTPTPTLTPSRTPSPTRVPSPMPTATLTPLG